MLAPGKPLFVSSDTSLVLDYRRWPSLPDVLCQKRMAELIAMPPQVDETRDALLNDRGNYYEGLACARLWTW